MSTVRHHNDDVYLLNSCFNRWIVFFFIGVHTKNHYLIKTYILTHRVMLGHVGAFSAASDGATAMAHGDAVTVAAA